MKVLLSCVLLFLGLACHQRHPSTYPQVQTIVESVYASGKVVSQDQYLVYASVSGVIEALYVSEGDTVAAGAPLLTLQNKAARLSTQNAQTTALYRSIPFQWEQIRAAEASVDLARSKLQNDSSLLSRQQRLWAQDIGSRYELEQRELALKTSQSAFATASLQLQELRKELKLTAAQAQNSYQVSRAQLQDYTVRAERAGRVYALPRKKGEMVSVQTPVAVIGDAHAFFAELKVDELDIAKIRIGQTVYLTLDSHPGTVFRGRVRTLDPLMEESSRSFTVDVAWEQQPPVLFPNLTVEASIIISTKPDALTLPRDYLLGDSAVQLASGRIRKVKIGLKDYQRAEILSGLTPTDRIQKPAQ